MNVVFFFHLHFHSLLGYWKWSRCSECSSWCYAVAWSSWSVWVFPEHQSWLWACSHAGCVCIHRSVWWSLESCSHPGYGSEGTAVLAESMSSSIPLFHPPFLSPSRAAEHRSSRPGPTLCSCWLYSFAHNHVHVLIILCMFVTIIYTSANTIHVICSMHMSQSRWSSTMLFLALFPGFNSNL